MPAAEPRRSNEELARLAADVYQRQILPALRPEDDGKFVALDIDSGDYEVNEDDYTAVMTLRARCPAAEIWLERVGEPTAYKMFGLG